MMPEKQLDFRDERPDEMSSYLSSIQERRHPIGLLTDHLDDPRNLGMLFRLADAARLSHLWIYGDDERILKSRKFRRTARSTLDYVPHSFIQKKDIEILGASYQLVALEITSNSIPLSEYAPDGPVALVIGNEASGVSEELLERCDQSVHIPMYGVNTSMNVAMASGIAVYGLLGKL